MKPFRSLRPILLLAPLLAIACSSSEPAVDDDSGVGGQSSASSSASGQGGTNDQLPQGCFLGEAACQPLTNANCEADEVCGVGVNGSTTTLSCFPASNNQQLGQACDRVVGPFCDATMTCFFGSCATFCCSDADCQGVPCTAIDPALGSLGACGTPPMCQSSGSSCSTSADCCSNDCHAGHCH